MTGVRFDNDQGQYVNDKTHKMPYAKLATILTYKAHLDGRECLPRRVRYVGDVLQCGSQNMSRKVQGRVECHMWIGRQRGQERCVEHRQTSRR